MLAESENSHNGNLNELCQGTFAVFRPTEKSFFLTFTQAGHTALKFRTKAYINLLQEE